MDQTEINQKLEEVGAVITDSHFVYTSGKHGRAYVNWAEVLTHPFVSWLTTNKMEDLVWGLNFETIIGPTHTGDKIAYGLALNFRTGSLPEIHYVYAQESDGGRVFPRGQDAYVRGKKILIVDDILTTGSTIDEVLEAIGSLSGVPVGIVVGCNRSSFDDSYKGIPLLSLVKVDLEQWEESECPICKEGILPREEIGHGKNFMELYGRDPTSWPANRKR